MKWFWLLIILFMPVVNAQIVSESCSEVSPYDYEALTECQIDSYVSSGNSVMAKEAEYLKEQVISSTNGWDIVPEEMYKYYRVFQYFFAGLLVLITALNGYRFMITAHDPINRDEAKHTFKFIMVAGVLIVFLPIFITEIFSLSNATTDLFLHRSGLIDDTLNFEEYVYGSDTGVMQSVDRFSKLYANVPLFVTSAKAYIVSMNARHIMILLLVSLAPMILLMFIFSPAVEYGRLLLYLFFVELFFPVANVLVLHFSVIMSGEKLNMILFSSALILSVVLHLVLIFVTALKASLTIINQVRYEVE